jgi:hypothetical protein
MKTQRILTLLALCSAAFVATLPAQEAPKELPSQAEMWKMIQAQQQQIETLTALVQTNQKQAQTAKKIATTAKATAASAQASLKATQQQVEATSIAVEEIGDSSFGAPSWFDKTSLGGYGELHANFPEGGDNKIDFHRFVLFVNHEYNDWITLFTELELEHALVSDSNTDTDTVGGSDPDPQTSPGEVELEQAFVRLDWTESFSTDVGLFLLPIGITNETHEPNTFYGVERNNVEKYIIPTTWWEGGIKGTYRLGNGLAFDGAITSGLDVDGGYIRGGRQKVASALNEEAAFTGRVKYTGVAGLEVAASAFYQDDLAQSDVDADYSGLLTETHIDYSINNFRVRALYARWDLDGDVAADAEEQQGFYIEPSYRWELSEHYGDLGVYVRYNDYEYFNKGALKEVEAIEFGVNYWPTDNVVFKFDYQDVQDSDDAINLGFGYQF